MNKAICAIMLGLACFSAAAAPSFKKADEWRRELRSAIDGNQSALLKGGPALPAQGQRWDQIQRRAAALFGTDTFGPFGACLNAATGGISYWQDMVSAVNRPSADPVLIGGLGRTAFEAGAHYWACREAIDALETSTPKR